jgi:hypothetical protein
MSDWEAWSRFRSLAWSPSGGFSAGLGSLSRSAQDAQKSTEGTLDTSGRELLGRTRPFPRQALVGDQWSGQPQLPEDRSQVK